MKSWKINYKGHDIKVTNSWSQGESLYVNDQLQDQQIGFSMRSRLFGSIKFDDGREEKIKVSLGGWLTIGCRIFVNDKLIVSDNMKRSI